MVDKTYNYVYFIDRDHPLASNNAGRVHYHRHMASIKIGRWVRSCEHVHHKDGNKANNEVNNLEVIARADHARLHNPALKDINCPRCKKPFHPKRSNQIWCSMTCRGGLPSTADELLRLINGAKNTNEAARMVGCSDRGLSKCADRLGVKLPKRVKKVKPPLIRPQMGLVHGTRTGYVHYNCRCHKCSMANREYARRKRSGT